MLLTRNFDKFIVKDFAMCVFIPVPAAREQQIFNILVTFINPDASSLNNVAIQTENLRFFAQAVLFTVLYPFDGVFNIFLGCCWIFEVVYANPRFFLSLLIRPHNLRYL